MLRAMSNEPAGPNVPVAGLYTSALPATRKSPPVTNTRPLPSKVAVSPLRASVIDPVGLKVPVEGLYSSAEEIRPPSMSEPPAMRTRPSGSSVEVAIPRLGRTVPSKYFPSEA